MKELWRPHQHPQKKVEKIYEGPKHSYFMFLEIFLGMHLKINHEIEGNKMELLLQKLFQPIVPSMVMTTPTIFDGNSVSKYVLVICEN